MAKKGRGRPAIVDIQFDRKKNDGYRVCRRPWCKNIIAVWARKDICSRCEREALWAICNQGE